MTAEGRATVLIVDDSADNLAVLGVLLQPLYRVLDATSGEGALRIAYSLPWPNLILLDLSKPDLLIPDLDGYAVLARLRSHPASRDILVVFLTGQADAGDEECGLGLGAAESITKPIKPSVVRARVRTQLEAKKARDWMADQNATLEAEVARSMDEHDLTQRFAIRALAHLAETSDPETGNQLLRTQAYVQRLALGLREHPCFAVTRRALYVELLTRSAPAARHRQGRHPRPRAAQARSAQRRRMGGHENPCPTRQRRHSRVDPPDGAGRRVRRADLAPCLQAGHVVHRGA